MSYAGRLQLIASVLESIQVYWASVFLLPKDVIKSVNRILKDFLWGSNDISKGKAKVAWKAICKPKSNGGLGLKDLLVWNKTLLVKQIWNIASKKDNLWVKWVSTVKLRGVSLWRVQKEANDSWGWKILIDIRDLVQNHIKYMIGNGQRTSMWYDNWSSVGPLINSIDHRNIYDARLDRNSTVAGMIDNGMWKWPEGWYDEFPFLRDVIVPAINNDSANYVMWIDNAGARKKFSMKTVYDDLRDQTMEVDWCPLIWFQQSIPKHSVILWMAIQEKLLTQDKIKKWGSYDMMVCALCKSK